jgi:5-methylcytosine-specific restriction endonuclease McrA
VKLCGGCQTKIPDDHKGRCAVCKQDRYGKQASDGIRSNIPAQAGAGKQHTSQAGYDAEIEPLRKCKRWNDRRVQVIRRDGACVRCKAAGRPIAPIEIVDHVIPAQIAIAQAWESQRFGPANKYAGYYLLCNLQGLCRPCHALKTTEDLSRTMWPNVMDLYDAQPKKTYFF